MNDPDFDARAIARLLMRTRLAASLATLDADGGPYASLVAVAPDMAGAPLLLISRLALHTRNVARDPRASILLDERDSGDPLRQSRISLSGRLVPAEEECLRQRYLSHHPDAEGFAGFSDFSLWRLEIASAHLVAGFGRIVDLAPADILEDLSQASALVEAEAGAVAHMNEDHRDAVRLYATRLAGEADIDWRFVACDPKGMTLAAGRHVVWLPFSEPVAAPGDLRRVLAGMARQARTAA